MTAGHSAAHRAGLLDRAVTHIRSAANWFVVVCLIYMLGAMVVQIGSRYIFNYSVPGTEETGIYAQIWMALVGAGIAMRMGTHVAVDFIVAALPKRIARVLYVILVFGALCFLGVVIYGSFALIEIGQFQTSPALSIPMWIVYAAIPVGSLYFALEVILFAKKNWEQPFGLVSKGHEEIA